MSGGSEMKRTALPLRSFLSLNHSSHKDIGVSIGWKCSFRSCSVPFSFSLHCRSLKRKERNTHFTSSSSISLLPHTSSRLCFVKFNKTKHALTLFTCLLLIELTKDPRELGARIRSSYPHSGSITLALWELIINELIRCFKLNPTKPTSLSPNLYWHYFL